MHFFIFSLLLNAVSNAVFATTKETIQLSTSMMVPEGANVTLNCTFNQSVSCTWKKNDNKLCIDDERFRFVYESRNEKPCNMASNACGDCHSRFQYNECSIHLLNYTDNVDSGTYECTGISLESSTSDRGIGGHTFQLITAISNNNLEFTNETNTNNINWMYMYVAVGCALPILIVAVITGVCVMKRKRKTEVASDSTNKNESSSVNVTLDTSGLSEEALVIMRKPQPNPRGLGPKRKSASTGCINPYAETHFRPPPLPLHASNTALTSGYSEQECSYSNLYDDVAVNRNNLHEIVPPSSTQYDDNHYALPDVNNAILPKVPPNSEVVYAEIVLTHKSRRK